MSFLRINEMIINLGLLIPVGISGLKMGSQLGLMNIYLLVLGKPGVLINFFVFIITGGPPG